MNKVLCVFFALACVAILGANAQSNNPAYMDDTCCTCPGVNFYRMRLENGTSLKCKCCTSASPANRKTNCVPEDDNQRQQQMDEGCEGARKTSCSAAMDNVSGPGVLGGGSLGK